MSTKAIRKALRRLAELEDGSGPEMLAALLEVERIEKAAKDLHVNEPENAKHSSWDTIDQIAEDAP